MEEGEGQDISKAVYGIGEGKDMIPFWQNWAILALEVGVGIFSIFCTVMFLYTVGGMLLVYPVEPELRVDSARVSQLSSHGDSNEFISATWDVTLVVTNPNHKLEVYLDEDEGLQVSIFYRYDDEVDRMMLATKPLHPPSNVLKINRQDTVSIRFKLQTIRAYVGNGNATANKEIRAGARLGLKLVTWYRFNTTVFDLDGAESLRLLCPDLQIFDNINVTTPCHADPDTPYYHYYY